MLFQFSKGGNKNKRVGSISTGSIGQGDANLALQFVSDKNVYSGKTMYAGGISTYDLYTIQYTSSYQWKLTLTRDAYVNGTLRASGWTVSWGYATKVSYLIVE